MRYFAGHGAGSFGNYSMTGQGAEDCDRIAPARPTERDASSRLLAPELEAVLRPFLDQSAAPASIVAVGCHPMRPGGDDTAVRTTGHADNNEAVLLGLAVAGDGRLVATERTPMPAAKRPGRPDRALEGLARQAGELTSGAPDNHLLILAGDVLEQMIARSTGDLGFRAVVVLPSLDFGQRGWKLQRALFDSGLVRIGTVQVAGGDASCFLASGMVSSTRCLRGGSRGVISMKTLGNNGRFGNQLFQYAFMKLYALRHGVTAAVPEWRGKYLYPLEDESCANLALPQLDFPGHLNFEHELWNVEEPPVGVDMHGWFQEIPTCWWKHRQLLRRLFQLPVPLENAIEAWRAEVTRGGKRTLVAIHLRRGDYLTIPPDNMWLRVIPEEWYLTWLRSLWPSLDEPLLFVATDDPDGIRPIFAEFETVLATVRGAGQVLPDFLRDFEILRRADYVAICNSSFSRMAAILAHPAQKCFLPTFRTRGFLPYDPWLDRDFWARFATN
ncbi:MAG: alpha-1,2-fucosyltransferase [Xanthobacteraceae bacterium]